MNRFSDIEFLSKARNVGCLTLGQNKINILHKEGYHGLLDGRKIIEADTYQEFITEANPILTEVICRVCKTSGVKEAKAGKNTESKNSGYGKIMDSLMKAISKHPEEVSVYVLSIKPDEMSENTLNKAIRKGKKEASYQNLPHYIDVLKDYSDTVEKTMAFSGTLLRTRFSRDMWGSKEVDKVLSKIRDRKKKASDSIINFERAIEVSDRNMKPLYFYLKNANQDNSEQKDKLNRLIKDFYAIKGFLSYLAKMMFPLYDIDWVFKKHTGYPTTWFFNSSVFYEFLYCFENLIESLIETVGLERRVIEPLSVLK